MIHSREPELFDCIETVADGMLNELHTSMPGKIVKYDNTTMLADVQPMLARTYVDEEGNDVNYDYPVITDVPIQFPRGAGFFVSFPLTAGDLVWLSFSQRSMDNYLESDGKTGTVGGTANNGSTDSSYPQTPLSGVDPQDGRRHHISDAVAFPCGNTVKNKIPGAQASATNMVVGLESGACTINIKPDGGMWITQDGSKTIQLGSSSTGDYMALASLVNTRFSNLESLFNSHIHPVITPLGGSTTPTTTPLVGATSTASARVLVDK